MVRTTNSSVETDCRPVDPAEEEENLRLAFELAFDEAPMLRREGEEGDDGEGEACVRRRCRSTNTGCGCVLAVESETIRPPS